MMMAVGHVAAPGTATEVDRSGRTRLLSERNFARLTSGQIASQIADATASVAIAGYLFFGDSAGPSRMQLLQLVVTAAVPLVLAGPIAGYLSDLVPRRRLLIVGQCARAGVLFLLATFATTGQAAATLVAVATSLCLTRVLYTARCASVRHAVRRDDIVAADSLLLAVSSVCGVTGGVIGLALHNAVGLGVLFVAGVGHLIGAASFFRIDVALGGGHTHMETARVPVLGQATSPRTRFVVSATAGHRLLVGVAFATVALAESRPESSDSRQMAFALAALGCGSFVGTLFAERASRQWAHPRVATLAFITSAIACTIACLVTHGLALLAVLWFTGIAFQVLRVYSDATVQGTAQHGSGGRLFAVYDIGHNLAFLAGIGVALIAAARLSAPMMFAILTAANLAATTVSAHRARSTAVRMHRGRPTARRYGPEHVTPLRIPALHDTGTDLDRLSAPAVGGARQHLPADAMRTRHFRIRTRGRTPADGVRPDRRAPGRRVG